MAAAKYVGYLAGALARQAVQRLAIRAGLAGIALFTLAMGRGGLWLWMCCAHGRRGERGVLIHVSAWCLERLAPLRRPALSGAVYAGGAGQHGGGALCLADAARFHRALRVTALGAVALAAGGAMACI